MRQRQDLLLSLALVTLAKLFCIMPASAALDGQWPMWRHDGVLTAHQPLPGEMEKLPRVLAKHFVGAEQGTATFADVSGTGKKNDVIIAARARLTAYDSTGKRLWESSSPGYV